MEIDRGGELRQIDLKWGEAVFVPGKCWNKPLWSRRVTVLNVLFGKHPTGISLVRQERGGEPTIVKTHFNRPMEARSRVRLFPQAKVVVAVRDPPI